MTSSREELAAEIQEQLIRAIAALVLYNHAVSAKVGLGASDSQFMTLLRAHGPLTPRQLADHTGLTSGTITGVIDRLEAHGFVTREADPTDRRKVVVTPALEKIQETMVPLYAEQGARLQGVLASRTDDELRVILRFLSDAVDNSADPG
ncbi:MarR family transcriptional regulator [Kribbella solani]|uniref:MarR family winged helix-turn-helix transcriptional regulator n=1 Tax=Kribbella solani TaxID=236067 RepID=UPI0029A6324B|nr:MarR family transcriptional regulator [Kribbella solani]MDX2970168.1 MarR family transcriptional regulator [Kribbella solani]MDX3004752.1 MarR family transcriptional regulator [Kribbella solani]